MNIDFKGLRNQITIEQVATHLGMKLTKAQTGEQYRSKCPVCNSISDRAWVYTPSKGLWRCFNNGCGKGGDALELFKLATGKPIREAASELLKLFNTTATPPPVVNEAKDLTSIASYLVYEHDLIRAVGLDPETCKELGCGYKPKGLFSGRLAVPITWKGSLVAYVGRALKPEQAPDMMFPKDFDREAHLFVPSKLVTPPVYVTTDVIKAIAAAQCGMYAISFLGNPTKKSLATLTAWMEENNVPECDIL